MVITLETRRHNLFNYDMLTDPDRLIAATITALDLAIILEAAERLTGVRAPRRPRGSTTERCASLTYA
jgi:hypothetical protein